MTVVIPENTNPESNSIGADSLPYWSVHGSYSLGMRIQRDNKIYTSLSSTNIGNNPETSPIDWYFENPTNQTAFLDGFNNTQSMDNKDLAFEFNTQDANTVALFGLVGTSVFIELRDSFDDSVVYSETVEIEQWLIQDWWEYAYPTINQKRKLFFDIPPVLSGKLKITIATKEGLAKCGNLLIGKSQSLGCSQYGATVSLRSNTRRNRNSMGRVFLKKGASWDRMQVPVLIEEQQVDTVLNVLRDIDGVPTLFVGDERENGIKSLLVFGFFRDLDVPITVSKITYNIEIEGVG